MAENTLNQQPRNNNNLKNNYVAPSPFKDSPNIPNVDDLNSRIQNPVV